MVKIRLFKGKKGIVDDLFDMLFVIVVLFFGMFIIYFALAVNADARETASLATVYGPDNHETLIQMLNMEFIIENVSYSGAEFVLLTVSTQQEELFTETITKYLEDGRISGAFVVYEGNTVDDNTVFSLAFSGEIQYFVQDPATTLLENPENSETYLVAFYGEEK